MKNKFLHRLVFDILIGVVVFLPVFSAIFLWQTFFNDKPQVLPPAFSIPKLDEKAIVEIEDKTKNRQRFSKKLLLESKSTRYGEVDPFGP